MVLTGFEDYFKRIQPFVQTQVIELPMAKRGKNDSEADILKYCQIEGESILNALKPNETLIALEVGGRELSTEKLRRHHETMLCLKAMTLRLQSADLMVIQMPFVKLRLGIGLYQNQHASPNGAYFVD